MRNSNPHNIIIGHLNVNSVKNKIDSIKTYFQNYLDLLVLAETKLDQTHPTAEIFIKGYRKPFRKDKSKHSGGLLLYLSEEIPSRELTGHTCPDDIQNIVRIKCEKTKMVNHCYLSSSIQVKVKVTFLTVYLILLINTAPSMIGLYALAIST